MELQFNELPKAVTMLTNEVSELKRLLLEKREQQSIEQPEAFLNIKEAARFLNLTVPTIYSKVSKREIPFMKKSKRLYFSKEELINYVKEGRTGVNDECQGENFLKQKGGKNE